MLGNTGEHQWLEEQEDHQVGYGALGIHSSDGPEEGNCGEGEKGQATYNNKIGRASCRERV